MSVGDIYDAARAETPLARFRCSACRYGASCRIAPQRCPMCGGSTWELDSHRSSVGSAELAADRALARASRVATTSALVRVLHSPKQ